jgi:DNA repair exonuclease SbcCD nuclease subunit
VALRLLHFADLHLDRSFAREGLSGTGAQQRRQDLRFALQRIVERARQQQVELITCAGDLFEQDHVTRDTGAFLLETLGSAGMPVLIAPGHSDPAVPSSPYRYLRWPSNVAIAAHDELRPYRYGDVQVWSGGFMRPEVAEAPLRDFAPRHEGINLLLLHASEMTQVPAATAPYKPILSAQIEEAGFRHALLGHYHSGRSEPLFTYPGSPEPLGWSEGGPHCIALVTISDSGDVEVALEGVNQRRFAEETIDVTGISNVDELREAVQALRESKQLDGGVIRARLVGERARTLNLDPERLAAECRDGFAYLEFRNQARVSHDVESASQEFTSRGEMVRKLVDRGADSQHDSVAERALQLALDVFDE